MFFSHKPLGASKPVAIRGHSRKEETREEVLERTRLERERRKRQRLEAKAATSIQAFFRSWKARQAAILALKQHWAEAYGPQGAGLRLLHLLEDRTSITSLLFYLDCGTEQDVVQLAALARLLVRSAKLPEACGLWQDYSKSTEDKAQVLVRLRSVALRCLEALHIHRQAFQATLAAPRLTNPADHANPAPALLECILVLVAPDTYTAALGPHDAATLSASIVAHLANHGMATRLRQIMVTAGSSSGVSSSNGTQQQKPYAEALATQLTVRTLALKAWVPRRPGDALHVLFFVPGLWRMCTSMAPVASRLTRSALTYMVPWAVSGHLADLLPNDGPGGKAGAAAVLLGNLLPVGSKLLQPAPAGASSALSGVPAPASAASAASLQQQGQQGAALSAAVADSRAALMAAQAREAALGLVKVMTAAVELIPLQPFFPAAFAAGTGTGADERRRQQTGAQPPPHGSGGNDYEDLPTISCVPRLAAPIDEMLPREVVAGVQGLVDIPGRQLLKLLVTVLLPCTRDQPLAWQPGQPVATLLAAAEGAYCLSRFVVALAELPAQHQRVMLPLAVSANFVERLWWSFLRPARAAEVACLEWLPPQPSNANVSHSGTHAVSSPTDLSIHGAMEMLGTSPFGSITHTSFIRRGSIAGGTSPEGTSPHTMSMDLDRNSTGLLPANSTGQHQPGASILGFGSSSNSGHLLHHSAPSMSSQQQQLTRQTSALTHAMSQQAQLQHSASVALANQQQQQQLAWRRIDDDPGWMLPLVVLCDAFSAHIMTSDLDEFYVQQRPLALDQLHCTGAREPEQGLLAMLRDALWQVLWTDGERQHTPAGQALYDALADSGGHLFAQLYERNSRRSFCPPEAFHATSLPPERFLSEANTSRSAAGKEDESGRVWMVLRHAPVLVPFTERAKLFQQMVAQERQAYREMEEAHAFEMSILQGGMGNRFVQIRRNQLLYDGFDKLNTLGEGLKGRVRVSFIDQHGAPEAGVDGGGLFKDFMEELMKQGFSTQYGLFAANAHQQLYPNPAALGVVEEGVRLLEFLGRMLGKALYENILLELPLAGFFRKKFRGAHCDLNDLPTLDEEVYRNLLMLRHYQGDVASLGLTFTITETAFGTNREVELKPGGRDIAVTADNVMEYIHRVAHYRLNIAPRPAVAAFLRGFYELIPPDWVAMFSGEELQTLLSGDVSEGGLDLQDLREHVEYSGGYHEDHPVIEVLWRALESFSVEEQRAFLRFVTACSRAPLLGFKYLEPKLCIQMAGSMLDPSSLERLPTAATCMNLLKLPPYRTLAQMREKLLYAVTSGAGFDLS